MDVDDILAVDLELFEISGAPIEGIPKKARENAEKQVKIIVKLTCK